MRAWLVVLALALSVTLPRAAAAQTEPNVSASLQPTDVDVGEPFIVQLTVTTDASGPSASDPRLVVPDALRTGQPSMSSQTQISMINGRFTRSSGFTATWQVVATREGVYNIAPPTAAWNGRRVAGRALRVTVHAQGSPNNRRRVAPTPNPFDPFGMFPRLPNFLDPPTNANPFEAQEPPSDPELSLDAPLDAKVFLRSVVDTRSPVVGEQVTLTIYIYARMASLEITDQHEPSSPDFFRRELLSPSTPPEARTVYINGVAWRAQPIFKVALFPLHAGAIDIGPMQVTINARASGLQSAVRASQTIHLRVNEPPAAGRPVGYQMGDVGAYTLSASVDPRTSEVGGAVAVTISLSGVGNVPTAVRIPLSAAAEWLEPQLRENIEVENGKVRGSRTFTYLVRPKTAGALELGVVTLPYWNPERKAYETARAALGQVQVAPNNSAVANQPTPAHDPWSALGAPRTELRPYVAARPPFTDLPLYWIGLFGVPAAVVIGSMGSKGARRVRANLAARRAGADRAIEKAMIEAREAEKKGDRMVVATALDRALYLAVERATGLRARALMLDEVPRALDERGVPAEVSAEVGRLLASIEALRFVPDGGPNAAELVERTTVVLRGLSRVSPGKG